MEVDARIEEAILAFIGATTEQEIYQTLVTVTADLFPTDICKVATVEEGALVPRARSDNLPVDPHSRLSLTGNFIGQSVVSGTSTFVNDIHFTRSAASPQEHQHQEHVRAMFAVPVADDCVLIGAATEPDVFELSDRECIERLVSYAEAALERLGRDTIGLDKRDRFDEFGTVITHELRGPLAVAHGYTEQSRETGDIDSLDIVIEALERLDQIITDIHTLVHTGWRIDERATVSLESVASDCWATVDDEGATLSIDGDLEFRADRSQLRHLLENLFRNAVEHGGPAARITVGAMDDGFYVEDTGPGIPQDRRTDVFDPGFTTSDTGIGYGLAIVKRIVEAHTWEITVTEGLEGGTRFEITGVR